MRPQADSLGARLKDETDQEGDQDAGPKASIAPESNQGAGQITSVALKGDQVNDQTCGGPLEFGEEGWATLEVGNEGWAAMEVGNEGGGQEGQPTPEDSAAGRGRVQERQIAGVQSRWRAAGDLAWHRQRWLTDDLGGLAVGWQRWPTRGLWLSISEDCGLMAWKVW